MDGVIEAGGAAGETFFNDQIFFSQMLLQQPGPALLLGETDAAVQAVRWVGTVAVGVGIAEADHVFFHRCSLPFSKFQI